MYRTVRVIHLIAGLLLAPVLLMYAVSAIQMGHRSWFRLKPTVEIASVGTTREVRYDAPSNTAVVRTSRLPIMGVLNRMHHMVGLWHPSGALKLWALVVALASIAVAALIATGVWLWMLRKRERRLGLILVAANVVFSLVVLILLRTA